MVCGEVERETLDGQRMEGLDSGSVNGRMV